MKLNFISLQIQTLAHKLMTFLLLLSTMASTTSVPPNTQGLHKFKDGVKELVSLLSSARVLCNKLGKGSKNPIVKQVFSKASENSQTAMYSVDKLMQTAHEVSQEEAEAPSTKRKRRDSGDKKIERHIRDGTTKWTDTTCKCGVEKHTKEELKAHIQRRHDFGK